MKTIYQLFPIVLFLVFIGCKSTNKQQEIVQLSNGETDVVTYQLMGDSVKTGYFSNGQIYYNGVSKQGFNGIIEREVFQYNFNGGIEKYACYLNDSLRYFRLYNEKGQATNFGGTGLIYLNDETIYVDSLKVGQRFFQNFRLAHPPHATVRVIYGDSVPDESLRNFDNMPLMSLPIKENLSGFLVDFNLPGQYTKVIYWSVEDSISKSIQKGRLWRKFVVTP
jgi:hypothetical protein